MTITFKVHCSALGIFLFSILLQIVWPMKYPWGFVFYVVSGYLEIVGLTRGTLWGSCTGEIIIAFTSVQGTLPPHKESTWFSRLHTSLLDSHSDIVQLLLLNIIYPHNWGNVVFFFKLQYNVSLTVLILAVFKRWETIPSSGVLWHLGCTVWSQLIGHVGLSSWIELFWEGQLNWQMLTRPLFLPSLSLK